MYSGRMGMVIPLDRIRNYHKDEVIEFEMKIVSEKLNEVAKDENIESGDEDSEPVEK